MLPAWLDQYVGLPFLAHGRGPDGYDCWGLLRIVLAREFGVRALPSYAAGYTRVTDGAIAALVATETARAWRPIAVARRGAALSVPARRGDVVAFNIGGRPRHVGLVINAEWMLHIERGTDSCLARWRLTPWRERIEGVYRYAV